MRRSLITPVLAASLLVGLGAAASAKPHHPPPPPPPPPAWSWAGYYAGVNLGYGWGSSNVTQDFISGATGAVVGISTGTVHPDGVIGGGQVGYNWQFGNWVPGIEADIQGSGQRGSLSLVCATCSVVGPVTTSLTEKLNWFGTVRGRLGWTVTPETMIYATGGLAYGEIDDSCNISDGVNTTGFNLSKTSVGWAAGAGVESHLIGNWTWKIEYLFLTLDEPTGSVSTPIIPVIRTPPSTVQIDPIFTDNIIRAGLNYKW
jgi:outer membrane immunogenic protein